MTSTRGCQTNALSSPRRVAPRRPPRARDHPRDRPRDREPRGKNSLSRNPQSFAIVRASPMTRASKNDLDRTIASRATHGTRYPTERTIETNERTNDAFRSGRVDDEDEYDKNLKRRPTPISSGRCDRRRRATRRANARLRLRYARKCQRCTFGHGDFVLDGRVRNM